MYVAGEVQAANADPSSEHSKVEPASSAEKVNVALALLVVAAGPDTIVVSGAVVSAGASTVQLYPAGVASVLPAASVALTWKVWPPSARPVRLTGDVQAAKLAPSSLHSKVAPASSAVKVNVALV